MNKLKELTLDTKEFEANGTKYFIASSLSIERMALREQFDLEFGIGASFKETFDTLREAYNLLNERKFADAAVCLNDRMKGIVNVEKKEVPAVRFCTLFINAEGEDITTYSDEIAAKKIEDWKREGIDSKFFFQLAALSTNGFINAFKEITRNTLTNPEAENQK